MKVILTKEQYNLINTDFKKLSTKEIKQFLYGGGFLPVNAEIYFNKEIFHYFSEDEDKSRTGTIPFLWYTLWEGNNMIAVAKVGDYSGSATMSLSYIDIDHRYRKKGLAKKLAEFIFEDFAKNKWTFETSFYSEMGEKYIKPLFNELAKKYHIKFIDRDGMKYVTKDYSQ